MRDARLRIAIQKSGRLSEESLALLNRCGIQIQRRKEQLFIHSSNFPLDLLLVRDDDIPQLVEEGVCDFGIIGTNVLQETALQKATVGISNHLQILRHLDFGLCRLSLALPQNSAYRQLSDLNGQRIATSYPHLLTDYAKENALNIQMTTLSGAVEIAPRLGIADGICDLVSTGATLEANNLREIEVIFNSQAVLIQSTKSLATDKQHQADIFYHRIEGAQQASDSKYIMLHAPKIALDRIVSLLPGAACPTIMTLQGETSTVAVHALCRESIFWETMEQLKAAGASAILVLPVEKMLN